MKLAALGVLVLVGIGCNRSSSKATQSEKDDTATTAPAAAVGSSAVVETVPAKCVSPMGVTGNGQITRTKRDLKGFVDVVDSGSAEVEVKEAPAFSVEVEADSNVQDMITTAVTGNRLDIGGKGSYCTNKLRIFVSMPLLHGAKVEGSGKVDATKSSAASDVSLGVNGAGRITFRGAATTLAANVNGSGAILLDSGAATSTNATVNGSGSVKKATFTPGTVAKSVNGSGAVAL
jgi:hypothetical protein